MSNFEHRITEDSTEFEKAFLNSVEPSVILSSQIPIYSSTFTKSIPRAFPAR